MSRAILISNCLQNDFVQPIGPLRVDWVDRDRAGGWLGMTLLPGRRDLGRELQVDIRALVRQQVSQSRGLLALRRRAGGLWCARPAGGIRRGRAAEVHHLPIVDQRTSSVEEMGLAVRWVGQALEAGGRVLVHCLGGLGRSGTVVACHLCQRGCEADAAIDLVR